MGKLWTVPSRATKVGKSKGGRRPKSGRQIIEDAAAAIASSATISANPAAEKLGLGPCLLGRGIGANGEAGRPRKQLTGAIGVGGGPCASSWRWHITLRGARQQGNHPQKHLGLGGRIAATTRGACSQSTGFGKCGSRTGGGTNVHGVARGNAHTHPVVCLGQVLASRYFLPSIYIFFP